jgi:hypothetical protein
MTGELGSSTQLFERSCVRCNGLGARLRGVLVRSQNSRGPRLVEGFICELCAREVRARGAVAGERLSLSWCPSTLMSQHRGSPICNPSTRASNQWI